MSSTDGIGEIDVVDLLEELDISNIHVVGRYEVGFSCPRTDGHSFGDARPSNHISRIEPHPFRCKSCGWTGTAFSLVGTVLHLSPVETTKWLRDRYGDGYREPKGGSIAAEMNEWDQRRQDRREEAKRLVNPTLPVESDCIGAKGIFAMDWRSDHPAVEYMVGSRGFDPDVLDRIGVGYDNWSERVTIPIRMPDGTLAGFKGRTINDYVQRKYDVLGDSPDRKLRYDVGYRFPIHNTRTVVFGLDRVVKSTRTSIVICEGELDAIALTQAGVPNAVATGTTTLTEEQQRLVRWHADEIVLFYDSDQAGFESTWGWLDEKDRWRPGLVEKLSPYLRIRVVHDHEGDPASMTAEEAIELIRAAPTWFSIATT